MIISHPDRKVLKEQFKNIYNLSTNIDPGYLTNNGTEATGEHPKRLAPARFYAMTRSMANGA